MKKPISQDGARIATGWPLKLNRFDVAAPPDPADLLDCILLLNNRADGNRARVVISDGSSFLELAFRDDIPAQQDPPPPSVQLVPQILQHPAPALPAPSCVPALTYDDHSLRAEIDELRSRVADLENALLFLKEWGALKRKERQ